MFWVLVGRRLIASGDASVGEAETEESSGTASMSGEQRCDAVNSDVDICNFQVLQVLHAVQHTERTQLSVLS